MSSSSRDRPRRAVAAQPVMAREGDREKSAAAVQAGRALPAALPTTPPPPEGEDGRAGRPPAIPEEPSTGEPGGDEEFRTDPEIDALLPPASAEELRRLEEQILADGEVREPVAVWEQECVVLEGRDRLAIATRHGIPCPVRRVSLRDLDDAMEWVLVFQLRRGSPNPVLCSYQRGKLYEVRKRQGERTDLTSGQNAQRSTTAERIAAEFQVDEKTVRRDAKFALALDVLSENTDEEVRRRVLAGSVKLTQRQIEELSQLRPSEQRQVVPAILRDGKLARPKVTRPRLTAQEVLKNAWEKADADGRRAFLAGLLEQDEVVALMQELLGQEA
jgi:hypothetical protein